MYEKIIEYVKNKYDYKPKTCWIAQVKELCGLKVSIAPNRKDPHKRQVPCPTKKINDIKEALNYVGMNLPAASRGVSKISP